MSVKTNIQSVKERIARAAERAGRDPAAVKIIAVVKHVPLDKIYQALEAGLTDIGENRVQEAAERRQAIKEKFPGTTIHLIGHLQRNKVGQALKLFDIIQSVDSDRLARELSARLTAPKLPVLVEVNVSGEASKYGIAPDQAAGLLRTLSGLGNLAVQGLMTMAPLAADPALARPFFAGLRQLRDELVSLALPNVDLRHLSMGMTDDFEAAVAEGADLVRIGRGIFQPE